MKLLYWLSDFPSFKQSFSRIVHLTQNGRVNLYGSSLQTEHMGYGQTANKEIPEEKTINANPHRICKDFSVGNYICQETVVQSWDI